MVSVAVVAVVTLVPVTASPKHGKKPVGHLAASSYPSSYPEQNPKYVLMHWPLLDARHDVEGHIRAGGFTVAELVVAVSEDVVLLLLDMVLLDMVLPVVSVDMVVTVLLTVLVVVVEVWLAQR
jgi:hypothetical protein